MLPNGLWVVTSFCGNRQTATLVVPQDVREIGHHPVYTGLGVSGVRVLPGSHLERIGRVALRPGTRVGDLCFWRTGLQECCCDQSQVRSRALGESSQTIERLVLPDCLRVVKSAWFCGSWIRELFVPQGVERIEDRAFWGCAGLRRSSPRQEAAWSWVTVRSLRRALGDSSSPRAGRSFVRGSVCERYRIARRLGLMKITLAAA